MKKYLHMVVCLFAWVLLSVSAIAEPLMNDARRTPLEENKSLPGILLILLEKIPCTYSISHTFGSFIFTGGTDSITVTPSSSNCSWTASESLDWVSLSPTDGTGNGTVTVTVDANTGDIRVGSVSIAGNIYNIRQEAVSCGADVAPGVWKQFDCYNLAAIGQTTSDDPFTPSWRLIGGYWKWGRKGPSESQWYNNNTSNFAHGPTGQDASEANDGVITGWDSSYALDDSWSDAYKTDNDPCPDGFRVPTKTQWEGVLSNNTQSITGTWSHDATNYSNARLFGNDLMLPTAGFRDGSSGALDGRGGNGDYWSSTQGSPTYAWYLVFSSSYAGMNDYSRSYGFPVRCIEE